MIEWLNRRFVPVYASNEDYREGGSAPDAEKALFDRIYREGDSLGLEVGAVYAAVLDPQGRPFDSLIISRACDVALFKAMLQRAAQRLPVTPGEPLVAPASQVRAPKAEPGELVIHVSARYLEAGPRGPMRLSDPGFGQTQNASWQASPAESFIVLTNEEWATFLPPSGARPGTNWIPDPDVAAKILTHFYPTTEQNDLSRNVIEESVMAASVCADGWDEVLVRLDGRLRMQHPRFNHETNGQLYADFIGYVVVKGRTVERFRMATGRARYLEYDFGVAAESVQTAD